jgi:hypothetical protein
MQSLYGCIFRYREDHRDAGFPANVAQLGTEGSRCHQPMADGQQFGYLFRYTPGTRGPEGKITIFTVEAVPVETVSPSEVKLVVAHGANVPGMGLGTSYYGDQTGVLLEHRTIGQPGFFVFPGSHINTLIPEATSILRKDHAAHPEQGYPSDLSALEPQLYYSRNMAHCFKNNTLQDYEENANCTILTSDRISYVPEWDNSHTRVTAYKIVGRPKEYAVSEKYGLLLRSYYTDQTGIIRGTPEDRAARQDDPEISPCEHEDFRGDYSKDCQALWHLQLTVPQR